MSADTILMYMMIVPDPVASARPKRASPFDWIGVTALLWAALFGVAMIGLALWSQ